MPCERRVVVKIGCEPLIDRFLEPVTGRVEPLLWWSVFACFCVRSRGLNLGSLGTMHNGPWAAMSTVGTTGLRTAFPWGRAYLVDVDYFSRVSADGPLEFVPDPVRETAHANSVLAVPDLVVEMFGLRDATRD
jgi:hypothetical protein